MKLRYCLFVTFLLNLVLLQSLVFAQTEIDSMRVSGYDFDIDSNGVKFTFKNQEQFESCDNNQWMYKSYDYNAANELTSYTFSITSSRDKENITIAWSRSDDWRMVEIYYEKYFPATSTYKRLEIIWENYRTQKTSGNDTLIARNIQSRNDTYYNGVPDPVYLFNDTNRTVATVYLEMIDFNPMASTDNKLPVQSYYTYDEPCDSLFEALKNQTEYDLNLVKEWVEKIVEQLISEREMDESTAMINLDDQLAIFDTAPHYLYAITDKKRTENLKRKKYCRRVVNSTNYERWTYGLDRIDPSVVFEVYR